MDKCTPVAYKQAIMKDKEEQTLPISMYLESRGVPIALHKTSTYYKCIKALGTSDISKRKNTAGTELLIFPKLCKKPEQSCKI